ncbi:MAG: hypothetical protein U1F76_20130 [Candidatus Competibacteraceae bacterium]
MNYFRYIECDPQICGGEPVQMQAEGRNPGAKRGTRITLRKFRSLRGFPR